MNIIKIFIPINKKEEYKYSFHYYLNLLFHFLINLSCLIFSTYFLYELNNLEIIEYKNLLVNNYVSLIFTFFIAKITLNNANNRNISFFMGCNNELVTKEKIIQYFIMDTKYMFFYLFFSMLVLIRLENEIYIYLAIGMLFHFALILLFFLYSFLLLSKKVITS